MGHKRIRDLQGLGEKSEQTLAKIGVYMVGDLEVLGAIPAYIKLVRAGLNPGLNFLYALVGALQGRTWLDVAQKDKGKLLMEMEGYAELEEILNKEV